MAIVSRTRANCETIGANGKPNMEYAQLEKRNLKKELKWKLNFAHTARMY